MISREAIKIRFHKILSIDESPHRISLAFAIGTFIAFSPTIGLHTVSGIAAARVFKLNLPVTILGTLVSNPWTMVFVYGTSICFGNFLLQNGFACIPESLGTDELLTYLMTMPAPPFTGTIILGIITALLGYFVMYQVLVRYKKNK